MVTSQIFIHGHEIIEQFVFISILVRSTF